MTDTNGKPPKILDVPIGLDATGMRREFDSLGPLEVPADRYWGAQTQRSLEHFNIGNDRMPKEVYHAYGYVKKAAAIVNTRSKRLPDWKGRLIERVCDEVISGALDEDFPLYVWQTGSGTQSNMNVNEVISNRCIQLVGGTLGSQEPVHPNDHVNMGQSSNDTFPTAMHIAAYSMATTKTIPALKRLRNATEHNAKKWADVVKIGRTHLEDATPLTVGQEWSGYTGALDDAIAEVEHATRGLLKLAMGGTAVGTGLNAPAGFGEQVAAEIAAMTGARFETAANKFTAQGTLDRLMRAHAGLKAAAVTLFKIANDMRWLGSGPRTGIHELIFPANEPGSSIMPGKVNPTQAEAMLMVAIEVIASDVAVTMGGAEGNFELNAFRPILISNYLHSALIMADMCDHFREFMIEGTKLNEPKLKQNIERSVMMVTGLTFVLSGTAAVLARYGGHALQRWQTVLVLSLVSALWLVVAIYFLGDISAHFNPAQTLAFALRRDMEWTMAAAYWVVQLGAAVCGSLLARAFFGPAGKLAATMPKPGLSWQAAAFEAVITFGLVLMVLNLANGPKLNGPFVPLAVGAYIMAWGTMGGPYDGAAMNPARAFGPDVALANLSTWWVYLMGPVAGAVIAVPTAYVLRGPAKIQEARSAVGTPLDRST